MFFKKKQAEPGFDAHGEQQLQTLPDPTGMPNLPAFGGDSTFGQAVKARPANVDFGFGTFVAGPAAAPPYEAPAAPAYEAPPMPTYDPPPSPPPMEFEQPPSVMEGPPPFEPAPLPPLESPASMAPPAPEMSVAPPPPAYEQPGFEAPAFEPVSTGLDDFAAPAPGIEDFSVQAMPEMPAPETMELPPPPAFEPPAFEMPPRPAPDMMAEMTSMSAPALDDFLPPSSSPEPEFSGDYWGQVSEGLTTESPDQEGFQVPHDPMAGGQFLDSVNQQLYPDPSAAVLNDALYGLDDQQTEQALEEAATMLFPDQFPAEPQQPMAAELESTFYATPGANDFDAIVQPDAPVMQAEPGFVDPLADLSNLDAPQAEVPNPDDFLSAAPPAFDAPAAESGIAAEGFDFSAPPSFEEPSAPPQDFSAPPDFGAPPDSGMDYTAPPSFEEPSAPSQDFSAPPDFGAPPDSGMDYTAPPSFEESSAPSQDFSAPPDFGAPPASSVPAAQTQEPSMFDDDYFSNPPTLDDMPDPLAMPLPEPQPMSAGEDVSLVFEGGKRPGATLAPPEPLPQPVSASDPSTWDINNLQILASYPLDRMRNLLVVQHDITLALMADNGNQNVAVLKVFNGNPLAQSNAFNAVKEGGVGDKEMYLVNVGTWQAIVSVDYQGVVLHTELTP